MNATALGLLKKLVYISLFISCIILSLVKVYEPDVFWHLKMGEIILNERTIPSEEPFSLLTEGKRWISPEWLSEVVYFVLYRAGGFAGLQIFTSSILLIVSVILFLILKRNSNLYIALFLTFITMLMMHNRTQPRPHMFSFLFLVILVYFYYELRNGRSKRFALFVPLLFLIWSNFHPGTMDGLLFLGLVPLSELLLFVVSQQIAPRQIKILAVVTFLGFSATFLTPGSFENYIFLIRHFRVIGEGGLRISEFLPSYIMRPPLPVFVITVSLLIILLNIKKTYGEFLPSAVLAYLAIDMRRWVPVFCILVMPVVSGALHELLSRIKIQERATRIFKIVFSVALIFLFLFTPFYLYSRDLMNRMGAGLSYRYYPSAAMRFIEGLNIPGDILNTPNLGGALILNFYPERKVLRDTRLINYLSVKEMRDGSYKLGDAAVKKIENAMVAVIETGYESLMDMKGLMLLNEWAVVWWDDTCAVFLRRTPENAELISRLEFRYALPDRIIEQADLLFKKTPEQELRDELERALKLSRQNSKAGYALAVYLMTFYPAEPSSLKRAEELLRNALRVNPVSGMIHYRLAECLERQGRFAEALTAVNKSSRLFSLTHREVPEFVIAKKNKLNEMLQ